MKKLFLVFVVSTSLSLAFTSCKDGGNAEIENTDVVPSGTYSGSAYKIDAEEKEVYVKTEDGKVLELYFTEETQLTGNGQPVAFNNLKEGQKLEVTVEKKGDRMEPTWVNIVQ